MQTAPCVSSSVRSKRSRQNNSGSLPLTDSNLSSLLFEQNPQAMCIVEQAGLRIVAANRAAELLYGYRADELKSKTLFEVSDVVEHERLFMMNAGVAGKRIHSGTWQHRRRNGDALLIRAAWTLDQGGTGKMLWTLEDQTALKLALEAAREAALSLSALVENSPRGLCRYNVHRGTVEHANRILLTLCGLEGEDENSARMYQRGAVEGRFVEALDSDRFANAVRATDAFAQEAVWRDFEGALRTVSIYGFPMMSEAEDRMILIEDITARQSLEQNSVQREKMEALGRVAATVAHDFNNILLVMRGYAEMLRRSLSSTSTEGRHAAALLAAADSAAEVTAALVGFTGKQVESAEQLDLNELVGEMANSFFPTLPARINGRVALSAEHLVIAAERSKMQRMLLNLAANARDAMPGGGRLTVSTRTRQGLMLGKTECCVEIRDTGMGMDEAMRARIFERFFTTNSAGRGTGLGLAFVESCMTQLGGRVEVESEIGQGSCFRLVFAREAVTTGAVEMPQQVRRDRPTILLVDDDEHIRSLVADFLGLLNYQVISRKSAVEALDLLRESGAHVDLLLSDLTMPGMSGETLAKRVQKEIPGMPVLLMSGRLEMRQIADAGFRVVAKPFSIREIQEQVELALRGSCASVA